MADSLRDASSFAAVATTSNAPANVPVNSSGESESDEEDNSELDSQDGSSEDSDGNQETDLSQVLEAIRLREDISDVLTGPIPSASSVITDAEKLSSALSQDFSEPQGQQDHPNTSTALIELMTNVNKQLEAYQPGGDIGPALHAARQVTYWSSIFVSMMTNKAPTSTVVTPSVIDQPSSFQATTSIHPTSTVVTPSCSNQPSFFQAPTSIRPTSTVVTPSCSNQPSFFQAPTSIRPTSTVVTPSCSSQPSFFQAPTSIRPTSTVLTPSCSNQPSSFQAPTSIRPTSIVATPSCSNQPSFFQAPTSTCPTSTIVTPSCSNQPSFFQAPTSTRPTSAIATPSCSNQPSSFQAPTSICPTSTVVTPSFIDQPSSFQAPTSFRQRDPATFEIFRQYGSGSFSDWLDLLFIPKNVDSLQQVKDLWELGTVNCPPLHKWTVLMRNHKSKCGRSMSSLFSQRKFMYIFFEKHNFDEDRVHSQYNELKPGKLYKILNTKHK